MRAATNKKVTLTPGDVLVEDGMYQRLTAGRAVYAQSTLTGEFSFTPVDFAVASELFFKGAQVFDADGQDGQEPGLWS